MASLIGLSCLARHRETVDLMAVARMVIEAPMEVVDQTEIVHPKCVVVLTETDRQKVEAEPMVIVSQKVALVARKQIARRVVPLVEVMRKIALVTKSLAKGTSPVILRNLLGKYEKTDSQRRGHFGIVSSPAFQKSRAAFMNGR